MTTPVAKAKNWAQKWNFVVEIDGFQETGFETCDGLEGQGEVIERNEGGARYPHKEPGKASFGNITLARGATTNHEVFEWFNETYPTEGQAKPIDQVKRNVRIIQYNYDGSIMETWEVYGAFPVRSNSGDFDGNANDHRVEELELAIDYAKPTT